MKKLFLHQPLVVNGVEGSDWQFELPEEIVDGYVKSVGKFNSTDEFMTTYAAEDTDGLISFAKESGVSIEMKPISANI